LEHAVLFCGLLTYQPILLHFALNEGNPGTKWGQRQILILKTKLNHFLFIIEASTDEIAEHIRAAQVHASD
jgi:hypothetical protein